MEIIKNLEQERVVKIIVEETRNVERERIIKLLEEYFNNLVFITSPKLTLKKIIKKITK